MFQFIKDSFEQVAQKVKQSGVPSNSVKVNLSNFENYQSSFQTAIYQKYLRQKLINKLNQFVGKKILVIDEFIADMLNLVIESDQILKENGIESIYYNDYDQLDVEINQIIFFVNHDRQHMKRIVRIIRNNQLKNLNRKYLLILCPRMNIVCKDYLEKEAVLGDLIITNFNFDLIPLASDLLSLEMNNCLRPLYIGQDMSILQTVAESIQRMELVHGKFKNIYAKGNFSKSVIDILKQKKQQGELIEDELSLKESKMHTLLIIERKLDFITPMLTPFTYEALIDEVFSIKHNSINLEIIKNEQALKGRPKTMKLNDSYYNRIKIMNIKHCQRVLEEKRQNNKQTIQSMKQADNKMNMSDMNQYLSKLRMLPKEQNIILDHLIVSQHLSKQLESILFNMCVNQEVHAILQTKSSQVEQMIENLISFGAPITKVIRLFSLYNQIQNGMKTKLYDFYRREILHMYGIEHIMTLENCEKMGLIGKKLNDTHIWEKIEKPLRLINEDIDHDAPEDFSYVFLAYAPIIVRIFEELILKNTWGPIVLQALKEMPGDIVIQQNLNQNKNEEGKDDANQIYVIYFIGGVTYGEIAAIRWLGQRYKKDIQICTTHIINGDRLVQEMIQNQ
ncbi:unnamed protein product [Paramecium octaurelia]|uniref:Uncharacterized protein n=1 Tax=Paramecium octaurelia TaxID=43137 RepID=A0A8S1U264_PAROT|nr:unnamed protein product [Paramecium octaurelia]